MLDIVICSLNIMNESYRRYFSPDTNEVAISDPTIITLHKAIKCQVAQVILWILQKVLNFSNKKLNFPKKIQFSNFFPNIFELPKNFLPNWWNFLRSKNFLRAGLTGSQVSGNGALKNQCRPPWHCSFMKGNWADRPSGSRPSSSPVL